MKKLFSIASALMLALGMGMTSCSNDFDEASNKQQPEETKVLYLTATTPDASTRSHVENVGSTNNIKITGWNDGDVVYGVYQTSSASAYLCSEFTYNSSLGKFSASVPTDVTVDDFKYFIHGNINNSGSNFSSSSYNFSFAFIELPTVDIANSTTTIPLVGEAGVSGTELTANMQLFPNLALIRFENKTPPPSVNVEIMVGSTSIKHTRYIRGDSGWYMGNDTSPNYSVDANSTVYLPVSTANNNKISIYVNSAQLGDSRKLEAGKIYHVVYSGN